MASSGKNRRWKTSGSKSNRESSPAQSNVRSGVTLACVDAAVSPGGEFVSNAWSLILPQTRHAFLFHMMYVPVNALI